jgi:patatin-like phospholipase/acyl hydrolase
VLVLTLDGGGMRGLFEAHVLAALEAQLGRPVADAFDLVSGTSTGGVLALGLTVGSRSPARIAELYASEGPRIFRRTPWARARQLLVSKYDRSALDDTLRHHFGDERLSAASPRVLVPAFSLARRDIVWFDSDCRRPLPRVKVADCTPLAWQVAAATSAAPTYFDPARVEGEDGEWLDGGVGANDPTPFAMAVALDEEPHDVFVLSLGTGGFFPPYPRRLRGLLGIGLRSMPSLLLYPTGLVAHDTGRALAEALPAITFARIAPDPNRIPHDLDDASPAALAALRTEADRVVAAEAVQAVFAEVARRAAEKATP